MTLTTLQTWATLLAVAAVVLVGGWAFLELVRIAADRWLARWTRRALERENRLLDPSYRSRRDV